MDLQDIWQEHRRWILGVLVGLIVFFAARGILDSVIGSDGAVRSAQAKVNALRAAEFYQPATRDRILTVHDDLVAEVQRLREALAFTPDESFSLIGKGDFDTYFPAVESRVRNRVLRAAQEAGVDFADGNLVWPAPEGREQTEATLIGLAAIEVAALRLVQAGERVRALNPEALGLVSIEALKIQQRPGSRLMRSPRSRGRDSSASELVREYPVQFTIRCDVQTLQVWLESLRDEDPPLALASGGGDSFKVVAGSQIGDPLVVKGQLLALTIQEPTER